MSLFSEMEFHPFPQFSFLVVHWPIHLSHICPSPYMLFMFPSKGMANGTRSWASSTILELGRLSIYAHSFLAILSLKISSPQFSPGPFITYNLKFLILVSMTPNIFNIYTYFHSQGLPVLVGFPQIFQITIFQVGLDAYSSYPMIFFCNEPCFYY